MQYAKSTKYLRSFQFLPCILSHSLRFFSEQAIFADRVSVYRLHIFPVLLHISSWRRSHLLRGSARCNRGVARVICITLSLCIHIIHCNLCRPQLFWQLPRKIPRSPAASPPFFWFFRSNSVVLIRYFLLLFRQISASYSPGYMHISQNNSSIILLICQ